MLLALETAQNSCSVALCRLDDPGTPVALREDHTPREQTRQILPMIEAVLGEAGIGLAQLSGVAFARGPGSFSGIRINTAVAQALGWAHDLPLLPVSSLQALAQAAWRVHGVTRCRAVIDARMNEVYTAAFALDAHELMQPMGPEQLCAPARVVWPADAVDAVLVGDGAGLLADAACAVAVWSALTANALDIASVGAAQWRAGHGVAAREALPVYLRDDAWKKIDAQRAVRERARD